eukprot:1910852-Amphidinium_carterae.1
MATSDWYQGSPGCCEAASMRPEKGSKKHGHVWWLGIHCHWTRMPPIASRILCSILECLPLGRRKPVLSLLATTTAHLQAVTTTPWPCSISHAIMIKCSSALYIDCQQSGS